jgi:hypothetical protein
MRHVTIPAVIHLICAVLLKTALIGAFWGIYAGDLAAGDWPQILGPDRNGVARDETLSAWGPDGPKTVWERNVGDGFAGVAVSRGRVILFHRQGDSEVIESLAADTGAPQWEAEYPTAYRSGIAPDSGPRCVPLIHGDHVFTFGAEGRLTCVELESGETVWTKDTGQAFQSPQGYFGVGSSPIVADEKLVVNVGSKDGAGLVAFDIQNGKTAWAATDDAASYSSPIQTEIDGVKHLIFVTRLRAVSVDPATGDERFHVPFGMRGPTVNGANPISIGEHVFLTASYGVGATLLKLKGASGSELWNKQDLLSSQYVTPVSLGTTLFGIDGRDDVGSCHLRAFDPLAGKIHWTRRDFGTAPIIRAGDKLLLMKTDGELVLAAANPEQYVELARTQLFPNTTRALPALANGRLYVRDTRTLKCIQVGTSTSRSN